MCCLMYAGFALLKRGLDDAGCNILQLIMKVRQQAWHPQYMRCKFAAAAPLVSDKHQIYR
jgi:hypothetical protein